MLPTDPGRRLRGSVLATVGFVLSPLSWWNDLLVNVPLAYAFATVVALAARDQFLPALVVGYWLTNVVGLVLLHVGAQDVVSEEGRSYTKRALLTDVVLAVGYTVLVVAAVRVGWLGLPAGLPG
ncbi:hypothetical protein ACFO0N_11945 [Halobium salinum]|uniref:Lycopene cyclase domain-containing protein n=1 Tax=Halobium salinum TaxID=1364940 RepID=A0ABD5PCN4_9EURY|nr:hypothetical protein [Halobium salinum]